MQPVPKLPGGRHAGAVAARQERTCCMQGGARGGCVFRMHMLCGKQALPGCASLPGTELKLRAIVAASQMKRLAGGCVPFADDACVTRGRSCLSLSCPPPLLIDHRLATANPGAIATAPSAAPARLPPPPL
eukprot:41363-Chlamydomonas_euryale.AAC.1